MHMHFRQGRSPHEGGAQLGGDGCKGDDHARQGLGALLTQQLVRQGEELHALQQRAGLVCCCLKCTAAAHYDASSNCSLEQTVRQLGMQDHRPGQSQDSPQEAHELISCSQKAGSSQGLRQMRSKVHTCISLLLLHALAG